MGLLSFLPSLPQEAAWSQYWRTSGLALSLPFPIAHLKATPPQYLSWSLPPSFPFLCPCRKKVSEELVFLSPALSLSENLGRVLPFSSPQDSQLPLVVAMQERVGGSPHCKVTAPCVHQDVELSEKGRRKMLSAGGSGVTTSVPFIPPATVSLWNVQGEASMRQDWTDPSSTRTADRTCGPMASSAWPQKSVSASVFSVES